MTESEQQQQIQIILARAAVAQKNGLMNTAKGWRDYAASVASRAAKDIVFARGGSVTDDPLHVAHLS